jgi:hypothetical protein
MQAPSLQVLHPGGPSNVAGWKFCRKINFSTGNRSSLLKPQTLSRDDEISLAGKCFSRPVLRWTRWRRNSMRLGIIGSRRIRRIGLAIRLISKRHRLRRSRVTFRVISRSGDRNLPRRRRRRWMMIWRAQAALLRAGLNLRLLRWLLVGA